MSEFYKAEVKVWNFSKIRSSSLVFSCECETFQNDIVTEHLGLTNLLSCHDIYDKWFFIFLYK